MFSSLNFLALVFFVLSYLPVCLCWGIQGHAIATYIAEHFLTPVSLKKFSSILENSTQAAEVWAHWPDTVSRTEAYAWSKSLHYVSLRTTISECGPFVWNRDCYDDTWGHDHCVISGIVNYTNLILKRSDKPQTFNQQDIREWMSWLVHYVEDIHQPLHTSFEEDNGGNHIHCLLPPEYHYIIDKPYPLHLIWDDVFIQYYEDTTGLSNKQVADNLITKLNNEWNIYLSDWKDCPRTSCSDYETEHSKNGIPCWLAECPTKWAIEGTDVCCNVAYDGAVNNQQLSKDYCENAIDMSLLLLAKSGVRLAQVLNHILNSDSEKKSHDSLYGLISVPLILLGSIYLFKKKNNNKKVDKGDDYDTLNEEKDNPSNYKPPNDNEEI